MASVYKSRAVGRTTDFRLNEVKAPTRYSNYFEKIVLVERIREVRALIGFTAHRVAW